MNSSTSHSDKRALSLILTILVVAPLSLFYTTHINPEIRFWKASMDVKREWIDALHQQDKPVMVFSGGSTTAFQVDNDVLLKEFGIASGNLGLHAGTGLDGTVALASTYLREGDELVLMSESGMLAPGGGNFTPLADQLLVATAPHPHIFIQNKLRDTTLFDRLIQCRPGLYHSVTMLAKIVTRRPMYRYNVDGVQPGGNITTPIREDFGNLSTELSDHHLSAEAKTFLTELRAWTKQRGIRLSYAMPVSLVPKENLDRQRAINSRFLDEIANIIPVRRDAYLGVSDQAQNYADTSDHMTREAAIQRTRVLAGSLLDSP